MKSLRNVFLFCTLAVSQFYAQEGKIDRADKKFEEYAFVDARKIYLDVAKKGYESADLFEKIADSYYFNGDYDNASVWYDKLITKYPDDAKPEYYFRYSQSLRAIQNYELADKMMSAFNAMKGGDLRAELFEGEPNYLTNIPNKKFSYIIEEIRSLNSRYSDFAPTEYEGKLIFASSRDTGGASRRIHKWNNQPFLDLYEAIPGEGKKARFRGIKSFSKALNSKFHESTTTFSKDGKTVYFTRNNFNKGNYRKSESGTNKLKIYKSRKKDGAWSVPKEMPFNSDEYSTAHPALSPDGTKLYFASDMPGTVGLSDIWVVSVDSTDVVGIPKNLGSPLNTEGRETFPYISENGNLYFASDGHPGFGGLDVFVTIPRLDQTGAEVIDNVGEPLNSSYDDFTFIINEKTDVGYFASNRKKGVGSDDIYRFSREEIPCDMSVEGQVTDQATGEALKGAMIYFLEDGQTERMSVQADEDGKYTMPLVCEKRYVVRAEKTDYTTAEIIINTPDLTDNLLEDFKLIKKKKEIVVGDDLAIVLNLNPIYFDLDRFNIRPDAAIELEKVISVMNLYPNMVIDVRSHTDSRGSDSYNRNLSDKRAKSTVAYIIDQGIAKNRITGEGYGESQLQNRCSNGVQCSKEEHQLNRRSEFIVIRN